ncbi:hypothetical protein [Marinoscillum sp.]|uniref:hypothetical protein n=1 Tax=Marinoscillum sp. TaxID=2024838 RepID=UPI003BAD0416
MDSLFLLNEAMQFADFDSLISGCDDLMLIEKESTDIFYKHESFYASEAGNLLMQNQSQTAGFLLGFLEKDFTYLDSYLNSEQILTNYFDPNPSAFLGVDFAGLGVSNNRQISNNQSYKDFKNFVLSLVNPNNFWSYRERLLPNLVLCDNVESQVLLLGDSSHFRQVIDRLCTLNQYVGQWNSGEFSYKEVNKTTNLNLSPESSGTMAKFGNQRKFSLPDGSREIFELHIKTGDLRFHIFPKDGERTVYVGYIGGHLDTISG